jgi:hypothetical protein
MRDFGTRGRRVAGALAVALASAVTVTAQASTPSTHIVSSVASSLVIGLAGTPVNPAAVTAEVARLQAELAKKTAAISALKRSQRGVRGDYELRREMAEANELARRLTALEAELRAQGAGVLPASELAPAPAGEASSVLAARADLLSDEARKLTQRAAGMMQAAGQLKARQALRRRAYNVERDAFAGLDGARRVVPARTSPPANNGSLAKPQPESGDSSGATGVTSTAGNSGPTTAGGGNSASSPGVAVSGPNGPTAPPPMGVTPPAIVAPTADPARAPGSGKNAGPTPVIKNELAPGSLLEPSLRAELARIDAGNSGGNDAEALLRAATALTNRAQSLEAEAKTLRDRASRR